MGLFFKFDFYIFTLLRDTASFWRNFLHFDVIFERAARWRDDQSDMMKLWEEKQPTLLCRFVLTAWEMMNCRNFSRHSWKHKDPQLKTGGAPEPEGILWTYSFNNLFHNFCL